MSAALRSELGPALGKLGFEGRFPHFWRKSDDIVQIVSVQFHSSGREFLLEFGSTLPSIGAEHNAPEQILAEVALQSRARLQTESGLWFRFARFGDESPPYARLARNVVQLLPQIDNWLHTGEAGPNIHEFDF